MLYRIFRITDLVFTTIKTEEDKRFLHRGSVVDFQRAIMELDQAGITQEQVQLLKGMPFSRFVERDYRDVLLLALAVRKKTVTIKKLHQVLHEREYMYRIYGQTTCIKTEVLPGIETINAYLGLRQGRNTDY